ncbi:putative amino-acid metabolite efflux pump [Sporomusa ovata DSM 2662]|uniref:Permease of the drug/metabolite transporter (DMT) superfamily n=1 Tax=Sporomusa ovata TaxID=2378 RepID=A0A0U1L3M0_9FIRM|nr:EamA family transporter [Sporomusa ovata]EQB25718.1 permease of the drug/metabolite transporter (DMT) superfamily [Sporomusa ovata DSM 2662]CQR74278.1 Permease of the drug/metabolite transporter (DMT) superfamily [Sporomusa ovata]
MRVHLLLVLVAFLWGINAPIMKIGLIHIPPMPYNAVRLFAALAVGWFILRRMCTWIPLRREDWKNLTISSLGFFCFQLFFTFGVQLTTAGNASLILACLPVSIAIINHFHQLEIINSHTLAGIVLSLAGISLMIAGTDTEVSLAGDHSIGAGLLLFAQLSYGYYTVFSRPLSATYSAYQITAYILLISTGLFTLVSLPSVIAVEWQTVPLPGWASIVYSGIFPLCLANCLWIWGTAKAGSTTASLYNNLAPVFAVAGGYFFLGETFGWFQFIGAVTILVGLYVSKGKSTKTVTEKCNESA